MYFKTANFNFYPDNKLVKFYYIFKLGQSHNANSNALFKTTR